MPFSHCCGAIIWCLVIFSGTTDRFSVIGEVLDGESTLLERKNRVAMVIHSPEMCLLSGIGITMTILIDAASGREGAYPINLHLKARSRLYGLEEYGKSELPPALTAKVSISYKLSCLHKEDGRCVRASSLPL